MPISSATKTGLGYLELAFWTLLIAAAFASLFCMEPETQIIAINAAQFSEAVHAQQIHSLETRGLQLVGRFNDIGKAQYRSTQFRVTQALPVSVYETALASSLSQKPFLGPIEAMPPPSAIQSWLHGLSTPKLTTTRTYVVRGLGLDAGVITASVFEVRHKTAGDLLKVTLQAETAPTFHNIYAVRDSATAYIQKTTLTPLIEHVHLHESEQAGDIWLDLNAEAQVHRRIYKLRGQPIRDSERIQTRPATLTPGSVLAVLAQWIAHTQTPIEINFFDYNEFLKISLIPTKQSTERHETSVWIAGQKVPVEIHSNTSEILTIRAQTPIGWIEAVKP